MINSISPLSFLLYTYHIVSLDPNKKMPLYQLKKNIKLIIYQTLILFYYPKLRRIFVSHNPRSFCEELNDIFCMERGIILGAQRIFNPLKLKKNKIKSGIHACIKKKVLLIPKKKKKKKKSAYVLCKKEKEKEKKVIKLSFSIKFKYMTALTNKV